MVAYNLLLSIFPFALLLLFFAGQVLKSPDILATVQDDLLRIFPSTTEGAVSTTLENIRVRSTTIGIIAVAASAWAGASFWGAMDTAFCRIYKLPGRGWLRQKRFALLMLAVSVLLMVATVGIPTIQSTLIAHANDLPFGLSEIGGLTKGIALTVGLILLFGVMCAIFWTVPNRRVPWTSVWPGALIATIAVGILEWVFPFYLTSFSSAAKLGTIIGFVIIVLLWFYMVALVILVSAAVNALRCDAIDGDRHEGAGLA